MYTIFYNDSYIYDPYENQECVTDVKLTANVNAAAYLDFTISPKHPLYNIVEERSGIVKVYYDDEKLFEGVVDSIEMDMYGYKSISCVSALDYLGDTRTRSYHTGSVEPTDKSKGVKAPESIDQFFQWLIDQHNQHVQNSNKTFVVGVNQGSSFSESNIIDVESTSHESTADAITNNLIDRYGGYLTLTYEGEQRVLNLYSDVHEMNAQIMDFGVNITNFTKTTTTEDQYTAVYPIGGTPENKNEHDKNTYPPIDISSLPDGTTEQDADIVKSGDVIFSRSAVARYGYKEYYYSENDILDATNLLKAAIIALRKSMSPKVSIDVKAIDCALFMKGYHHLAVGEAVRVRSNPHKVDEYLMVSSIDLDLQNPENTEYTLGTSYDTLTGQQSSYLRSLNSTINSAVDSVGALDKASKETAKTAQEAKANSIVAKDTANTAKDTADTAKNTADTAKDTADTAKNTANTAKDTADTAKNTADKAQTTAIAASNTAAEAKTTADSANNAAAELQKKTAEIDKQVEAVSNAADAASAKADQVRTDLQKQVDANKEAADAASAKADQVRTDLTQQVQNVKSEMDSAVEAAQTSANEAQSAADAAQQAADKANASTVDLDKSIKAVDAKAIAAKQAAAEAQSKAENVASDLDSANAVIEQHSTELGELTTKVTNAVNESESALSVSTEAKQTATEASTTATSAYADAQTALTQSTTATQTATTAKTTAESASKTASDSLKQSSAAVQTANQISTTLRTEYQTKADADELYATQSSLKQTSDSITASVSKTYATKDALSALQNVADNAIESWRGTGVPTLTNKPASDWTTNADKKKHSGDLYYDKSTGKAYRFGSDDGETYTWELNQDTDVTKALENAAKAQTSANNAQASATAANTAADNAQSTANTAVSNAATAKNAADAAQSSANKAQGDVDKLKIDIPETYATKSSLTQTAESITANVESVKATANSAVTAASNAQQTADGISANLTKNYQTKSQADTIYATKASLKATSDSISAEVTKAQGTADGAVTAASNAQQTADAVTLNLSKNYQTKAQNDALYATQTSLKATSDSIKAEVAETYTTKNDFDNLTIGGTNRIILTGVKPGRIDSVGNVGFDAAKNDHCYTIPVSAEPNTKYTLSGSMATPEQSHVSVAFYDENGNCISRPTGAYRTEKESWKLTFTSPANAATMRSSFPVIFKGKIKLEKGNKPTDWSPAPEDLQPAGDYATHSSLTQTANSIKAEVAETYTPKNDVGVGNLIKNGDFSDGMTNWTTNGGTSKIVDGTYGKQFVFTQTGTNTNGSNRIYNDTHKHINGQAYEVSFYAKADKSSKWYFGPTGSPKAASTTLDTTLKQYNMQYQADNTTVFSVWTDNPTATIYLERVKLSVASGYYATKSSLTQTANSIKAEVAETYTTKNDFNDLTVGGTNRIILTGVKSGRIDMGGNVAVNSWEPDHCSTILVSAEPNTKYTISGSISTPENSYVSVAFYDENGNCISRPTGAYRTEKESWKLTFTSPANAATMRSSFPVIFKGKIKLEKGNKPTDWSPAPEDLQPAGDYATTSSLTQTANSIKAQVTEVSNTANNAMSKATTVEQTANGLSSKITEQGKTLNATVTTANEAKSTADSNKTAISQTANLVDAALAGDNLITDGGFESTEWWKGLENPFRISTGSLYHGKHVLVCDGATGDNRCPLTHEKGMAGSATTIPVTKGRTYRLSGYCAWYLSVPSNVNPSREKLRLAKPDGSFIAEAPCSKSTSWSETHVDWKCPDDGSITSVQIEVMHQTNGIILWDDVAFRDITEAAATSNRVSSVEQNLNGFKTTVAETYQTKSGMSDYATNSSLTQTANSIKAQVTEVSKTANNAMSKATTVEQTTNGLQTTVTEQAKKLDDAVTTTSQVTQRVDSLSSTITQVQGNVNSLNASVRLINPSFETGDTTGWKFFGYQNEPHVNNVDPRSGTYKLVFPSIDYDGPISLENDAKFPVKAGEVYRISLSVNPDRTIPSVSGTITLVSVGLKFSDDSTVDYNQQFSSGWHEYSGTVTIPSGKTEAHFRLAMNVKAGNTVRVDSVLIENISDAKTATDTANSAISKSSSVEQNLNSFKTSVSQAYETKSDALNKQSSLQQSVSNLRTEVSETYTTKNDFDNLTIGGTNLIRNSDFSNGTSNWIAGDGNSGLKSVTDDVYGHHAEFSAVNGGRIYSLTSNVWENGQVYAYSFYAKASANGVRIQPSQSVYYWGSTHSLTTEWKHYTGTITCGATNTGGTLSFSTRDSATYYITRVKLEKGTKSTDWSPAPEDMLSKDEAKTTYSTKSYVDQTAQSVALGVVQNYKGADGSGLATKSDITVTTESITSTVAKTYATKSGVTQEISSKITQNNDSLDVKFATKTETQEAQNTANTANSNATNAQSRVGNIEDCITLTSNGVRAGKQSNGVFTGVSALVNTDGSFDLLDSNGQLLTRVDRHTFKVTGDNGVGSGYITLSQNGINITVMPTDDPDEQYYIRIGSGGISFTSPDGANMNCSATSGMILDTKEYGKLAIGPKGLQFTNDQGWGLQLGANGWSLNWAGNHRIATGPTGGKLYIDGHEIVTK